MPIAAPLAGLAISLGPSIYQGEQQKSAGKRGARAQETAQRQATSRAAAEQRRAAQELKRANQKKPNITSLLNREREGALQGAGATTLTGAAGASDFKLGGKSSLLGG